MDPNRKHLRFTCSGSADLTDGGSKRCWGQLSDISLGGFYVSTFGPLATNTAVRFKLDVEGQEICGTGRVATSHPGVGMAILYDELSTDAQKTLTTVIESLEQSGTGSSGIGLPV